MRPREAELIRDHKVGIKRANFEPGGANVAAFSIFELLGVGLGLRLGGG